MSRHALSGSRGNYYVPSSQFYGGPYGRMFRNLPAWEPAGNTEQDKLNNISILADSTFQFGGNDNPRIPAAYTYLGQFIDHDITFDPTSSLQRDNDPARLVNFRTPRFDLDCIYGRGPDDQPYLYTRDKSGKLLVGKNSNGEPDLPRNRDSALDISGTDDFSRKRTAIIGDMRNDENIIVSQLQLSFLMLHNSFIDNGLNFGEAQKLTQWHYQWVVIHDFLPRICGEEIVNDILGNDSDCPCSPNLCFYDYKYNPFMPVEFSGAAYRMGHSMVRESYHLNDQLEGIRGGQPLQIFGAPSPRDHLNGQRELPPIWTIQWGRFVTFQGSNPQKSQKIDTSLALPLQNLPDLTPASLAFRNLVRSWRLRLPSGQDVARLMCVEVIDEGHDPLWVYCLKEAELMNDGRHLGPVGGRIVAEVLIGLFAGDPSSFCNVNPCWQPTLPSQTDKFELRDLLFNAGMPMTAAEIGSQEA